MDRADSRRATTRRRWRSCLGEWIHGRAYDALVTPATKVIRSRADQLPPDAAGKESWPRSYVHKQAYSEVREGQHPIVIICAPRYRRYPSPQELQHID
jgi:hypothetical protein